MFFYIFMNAYPIVLTFHKQQTRHDEDRPCSIVFHIFQFVFDYFCESSQHIAKPLQSSGTNNCSGLLAFTFFIWFPPTSLTRPSKHDSVVCPPSS